MTAEQEQEVFIFPLSPAQQRLWVLQQVDPNDTAYHVPLALRLDGRLDIAALEAALNALVDRHEILRTTFAVHQGQPCQLVHAESHLRLTVEELGNPALLDDRLTAAARAPFDLVRGPVMRAHLFRLAPDCHILLVNLHHIACDGWSLGIMVREIAALYSGRGETLPEPGLHYADYVEWQRTALTDEALAPQIQHWRTELAGALTVLELPTDHRVGPDATGRGETVRVPVPPALTAGLAIAAASHGATLFMLALAAWAVLLNRLTGSDDLLIATPVANRHHGGFEDVIGFFVNTLPLRCRLDGNPTVAELIGRIRRTAVEAYANQDLPFEKLVELSGAARNGVRAPLVQTMLALQNAPLGRLDLPGWRLNRCVWTTVRRNSI